MQKSQSFSFPESWLKLLQLLNLATLRSEAQGELPFRSIFHWKVEDIRAGKCDWKVSKLIMSVSTVTRVSSTCWIVSLKDETGEIEGCVNNSVVEEFPSILEVGSTALLREVSIICSGDPGNPRYLNLHKNSIIAVISILHDPVVLSIRLQNSNAEEMGSAKIDDSSAGDRGANSSSVVLVEPRKRRSLD